MVKQKKKERTKAPDYLLDVIDALRKFDTKRLAKEEVASEHKQLVRAITVCNNIHGKGFTSISKARHIIQLGEVRNKQEAEAKALLVKEKERRAA